MSIEILTCPWVGEAGKPGVLPAGEVATTPSYTLELTEPRELDFFRALFTELPKNLYPRETCPQDTKAERALLTGTHPLSTDFSIRAYVAVEGPGETTDRTEKPALTSLQRVGANLGLIKVGKPLARCILTYYPDDPKAYVGLFECVEDLTACAAVLAAAEAQAKADGKEALVGPMDASIWVGYRFKTSNFEEIFTGEPNNLPYYTEFWEQCGFTVSEKYYSNYLRGPRPEDPSEKWEKRLQRALDKGYTITTPTFQTFPAVLKEIYAMLIRLYAKFPGFKFVTEEQFVSLFSSLRYVLDYDCVLLGYKDGELAGFFVCVPNYGPLLNGDISVRDLPAILKIRRDCKEYVILYIGADRKHLGLGGAFAQKIREIGEAKGAGSIAALIHEGNSSGVFFRELKTHEATYVLLEKQLIEKE